MQVFKIILHHCYWIPSILNHDSGKRRTQDVITRGLSCLPNIISTHPLLVPKTPQSTSDITSSKPIDRPNQASCSLTRMKEIVTLLEKTHATEIHSQYFTQCLQWIQVDVSSTSNSTRCNSQTNSERINDRVGKSHSTDSIDCIATILEGESDNDDADSSDDLYTPLDWLDRRISMLRTFLSVQDVNTHMIGMTPPGTPIQLTAIAAQLHNASECFYPCLELYIRHLAASYQAKVRQTITKYWVVCTDSLSLFR